VVLSLLGGLTGLGLDGAVVTRVSRGQEFYLGNFTTNSALYIGGLPPWYTSKLASLALPSVVFEPRCLTAQLLI
jgi:leucine-rich repeat transmembrane neuronal protein 1/2